MRAPGRSLALLWLALACGRVTHDPDDASGGGLGVGGDDQSGQGGIAGGATQSAQGGNATSAQGGTSQAGSPCGTLIPLEPTAPAIQVLVDTSLSMKKPLTSTQSRWEVVRAGLSTFFGSLRDDSWAGLMFYPNVQLSPGYHGETGCLFADDIAPLAPLFPEQRTLIASALTEHQLLGATPTEDAFAYARSRLTRPGLPHAPALVFITDGPPTYAARCAGDGVTPVDTQPLIQIATELGAQGTRTYVIALGEQASEPWLSEMASAGRTAKDHCLSESLPCNYAISASETAPQQLYLALGEIARRTQRCSFVPPPGLSFVFEAYMTGANAPSTRLNRQSISAFDDCDGFYTDAWGNIVLCRPLCDQFRMNEWSVSVRDTCP